MAGPLPRSAGNSRLRSAALELQHRNGADALGLLLVLPETGHALNLRRVDAVPFGAGELGDGDRISAGAYLDGRLARRGQVAVPLGGGRRATLGAEDVDAVVTVIPGQVN